MVRFAAPLLIAAVALAACNKPKSETAAASSAPAAAASGQPAASPDAKHNWVTRDGQDYTYVSNHGNPEAGIEAGAHTTVRYLGEQDGMYAIAEVAQGQVVVASCTKPCQEVRIRGDKLDQTLPLSPDSIVAAALDDAIKGQLERYEPPAAQAAAQAPAK